MSRGLGDVYKRQPLMFAALVTIALIGVALYLAVVVVERRLVGAWRSQT